jgi:Protein of unknown function (DUF3047)
MPAPALRRRITLAVLLTLATCGAVLALLAAAERLAPVQAAPDEVRLDDFDHTLPPGKVYGTWDLRSIAPFFGSGEDQFFQFVHEPGPDGHYVHLRSGDNNYFSLGVQDNFDLHQWPILEWEWKVTVTPKGGDVRVKAKDDQAGAMCVVVHPSLLGYDALCYLYENDGPKETAFISHNRRDSRYLIVRTVKDDGLGAWHKERRNMLQDYVFVFGKQPEDLAIVGMQIDSDTTESKAEAFYRNIYRRKR